MLYTVVHNMSSKVPFPVAERSQSRNLVSDLGLSTTAMAHCVPMCVCVALLLKTSKHLRQFRFHWPWFIEPDHDALNGETQPKIPFWNIFCATISQRTHACEEANTQWKLLPLE